MKITITGATGFVGINLQKYLGTDFNVSRMSLRYIPNQNLSLQGDAIIHLAGKAHDLKKVSTPLDYYEANFELTKQLFDAFLISNLSVFIFMSTVKAVADEVAGTLTEQALPEPKTHYGIAKRQAEEYILSQQIPEGKKVYILRPCMIHGPGNKGNLNLLYKLVCKGMPWPLGDFENQRSFLSVENLCFVINELFDNENIESGIYNVADDQPLSTNELIAIIGQSIGKKHMILNIKSTWIKRVAKIGDTFRLPLTSERLQKLTENYLVSNDKIVKAMGKKLPLSSRQGLINTFKSFKSIT
ncbi:NAD-dependent epimerase/dehydratase family protein [Flavobacterium sp. TAB 87]|uniref:NAD-dependent epimerase/dehydratase family protein n=1 Tax=Flavobacterium sp. TAB 87 TaxID=1729581 RepID=UPI00076DC0BC|nr:NAD-dependent epimerase/dehydratase family protein [Flavobacterium sp. TAB 87]KVV13974.1 GDP-6-deoxy-D-mannose reductase [Flavobacterium sp. TAB 87]